MISAAVVDASVLVKWVVLKSDSDRARALSAVRLEAPDLLPVECANILWKKARRGQLSEREACASLASLLAAPVELFASRELLDSALRLSLDLQHPVYDCVYITLALRRNIPLLTADRGLHAAATKQRQLAGRVILLGDLPLD